MSRVRDEATQVACRLLTLAGAALGLWLLSWLFSAPAHAEGSPITDLVDRATAAVAPPTPSAGGLGDALRGTVPPAGKGTGATRAVPPHGHQAVNDRKSQPQNTVPSVSNGGPVDGMSSAGGGVAAAAESLTGQRVPVHRDVAEAAPPQLISLVTDVVPGAETQVLGATRKPPLTEALPPSVRQILSRTGDGLAATIAEVGKPLTPVLRLVTPLLEPGGLISGLLDVLHPVTAPVGGLLHVLDPVIAPVRDLTSPGLHGTGDPLAEPPPDDEPCVLLGGEYVNATSDPVAGYPAPNVPRAPRAALPAPVSSTFEGHTTAVISHHVPDAPSAPRLPVVPTPADNAGNGGGAGIPFGCLGGSRRPAPRAGVAGVDGDFPLRWQPAEPGTGPG